MTDHGVLFKGDLVRAILDGRKNMTRRMDRLKLINKEPDKWHLDKFEDGVAYFSDGGDMVVMVDCPYAVGDRIWVRETCKRFTGCASNDRPWEGVPFMLSPDGDPYKALLPIVGNESHVDCLDGAAACVTAPSIHMPKWAARLWLTITEVTVERVGDISEADAMAEGVWDNGSPDWPNYVFMGYCRVNPQAAFQAGWHSIYGPSNPWVWAIRFKKGAKQ